MSDVDVCAGMMSLLTKKAFLIKVPARNPQVSRFAKVFLCDNRKKVVRSVGGRKSGRKGLPFSRKALGAKTWSFCGVSDLVGMSSLTLAGRAGGATMELRSFAGSAGRDGGWYVSCAGNGEVSAFCRLIGTAG